ncbi:hypothetical protein MTR67_018229 [Solanum verrucosum]|uniref:Uncharacterized protein n=1 Tax=Solanum verrucosum TaxID=315347 RepID=A0AAF0QRT1_SOLVR|nr:hypothetical protein MTR67_018229 [Solanum verrucosum]
MSSYQFVFGKSCHFLVELEHKVMWALQKSNLDWGATSNQILNELNDVEELSEQRALEDIPTCIHPARGGQIRESLIEGSWSFELRGHYWWCLPD